VSPGGLGHESEVGTPYPSFSWTKVAGASGYEIVVYAAPGAAGRPTEENVLRRVQLPAGAYSWTPELREGLATGRHGWAVAALGRKGEPPSWSRPGFFRVIATPSTDAGSPEWRSSTTTLKVAAPLATSRPSWDESVTLRSVIDEAYLPPYCGTLKFPDVLALDPQCQWIEQLDRDGIMTSCAGGKYCPDDPVTREQLARFLGEALRGTARWHPAQGTNWLAPPATNGLSNVDVSADAGQFSSITIGADGLPIISYYDATAGKPKVAHCGDVTCAPWGVTTETLNEPHGAGQYTSITIGADGLPIISYYDYNTDSLLGATQALKVAHCNDVFCAGQDETITTLDDPAHAVGLYTSIAISSDGSPIVSYHDVSAGTLLVAHCNDMACEGQDEIITMVDAQVGEIVGEYTSLAIGADGLPIISYFDSYNGAAGALKVAHCNDAACAGHDEAITTLDQPFAGHHTSLTIGIDGFPIISYQDLAAGTLKVAHCNDVACAGLDETITTLDDDLPNHVAQNTSITIGADGLPIISYHDPNLGKLKVAHCNDVACANQKETITELDAPPDPIAAQYTAITVGADGLPVVSYYYHLDALDGGVLKVAHCASASCTPYFRRR
jgi:hypothetical protein